MKKLFSVLVLGSIVFFLGASSGICDNLDQAASSAGSTSSSASRAVYGKDAADTKSRSRDVVSGSAQARDAAIDARAYRAADYEDQAYMYSSKAAGARSAQDARFFAKQAEQAANQAQMSLDSDVAKRRASAQNK